MFFSLINGLASEKTVNSLFVPLHTLLTYIKNNKTPKTDPSGTPYSICFP